MDKFCPVAAMAQQMKKQHLLNEQLKKLAKVDLKWKRNVELHKKGLMV